MGHDFDGWESSWDGFDRPRLSEGRVYDLWTPLPFVADTIAISEFRKARIKRQTSTYVFAVSKLCSPRWTIKQVFKAADIVIEIPAGQLFWESSMHEPLLIAIVFPFLRCKPWQLRSTPKMYSVGRELRKMFKTEEMDARNFLRQIWKQCHRWLGHMPPDVVRKVLFFGSNE